MLTPSDNRLLRVIIFVSLHSLDAKVDIKVLY